MKKIIAGAILLFSLSLSSQAQQTRANKGSKDHSKMQHNRMGKDKKGHLKGVDLTDAQKKQMQANKEAFKKQQNGVLTPAQQQQMEKNKQEKMAAKQNKVKENLSLSDAQMTQWKAMQDKNKAESKAIKDDATLSQEQRKEKLRALRESSKKAHMSMLNADQQKKMEEMKQGRKGQKGEGRREKMEIQK